MDDYNSAKDAGINGQEIPQDLLNKYASEPKLLEQVNEAHLVGKKAIIRNRTSRGRYRDKMKKRGSDKGE